MNRGFLIKEEDGAVTVVVATEGERRVTVDEHAPPSADARRLMAEYVPALVLSQAALAWRGRY